MIQSTLVLIQKQKGRRDNSYAYCCSIPVMTVPIARAGENMANNSDSFDLIDSCVSGSSAYRLFLMSASCLEDDSPSSRVATLQ